ncbi:LytR/AlgR family response regulator transcription factor [Kordiimonas sediminis]|nr:LytTR family DNA-binding domain-containing protein [Kordiimonas sediminis]
MTGKEEKNQTLDSDSVRSPYYLFGSRPLSHIIFWLVYYISFSLIWARPDQGYFASFYLEFILLPVRMAAAYGMIYILMPRYLLQRQYGMFLISYGGMLVVAGVLQSLFDYYFYETLLIGAENPFWHVSELFRSSLLVNTTVLVVASIKMFHYYLRAMDQAQNALFEKPIEIKSDRRTHILRPDDISHIESMGNYITYYLTDGSKLVAYSSMKMASESLPDSFIRIHRSYIINRNHIRSFGADTITIANFDLPRSKDIPDALLAGNQHQHP